MANPTIENLGRIIQGGDAETLMGGVGPASEFRVRREMQEQGMAVPPDAPGVGAASGAGNGGTFSEILRKSVDEVNTLQGQSDTAIKELVAGRSKNIHETMLTIERADTSLKLMMQVRNKILDAYREIMRMQV